jgi:Na+/H+-dicarboxylate symporter
LWPDRKTAKSIADYISLLTDIFLRLIKMIIAPLVFSTLVVGVAHRVTPKRSVALARRQ